MRNLPVFSDFLNMAALSDTEPVNFSTIARDCGASSQTIKDYYMEVAIESKATRKITVKHLKGLRSLQLDHPGVKRRLIVCCEDKPRITDDGIEIIPAANFTEMLWSGDVF